MTAPELLAALTALGATVRIVEDRLRVEAPAGTLTAEIRAALAEQKPALMALLRNPPRARPLHLLCVGCASFFMHEPATLCYWCRQRRNHAPDGPPCERCLGRPAPEAQNAP